MGKAMILITVILASNILSNTFLSPNDTAEQFCIQASEKIISNFEHDLDSAMILSDENNNVIDFFDEFCFHVQVISHKYESNKLFSLRRISDKNRNVDNAAYSYENDVINEFSSISNTQPQTMHVWNKWSKNKKFYYFKEIRVKKSCLRCHGSDDDIPGDIQKGIKDHYPNDNAKGYRLDEVRGSYVIMIRWPESVDSLSMILNKY
jgi:hypothetical protein